MLTGFLNLELNRIERSLAVLSGVLTKLTMGSIYDGGDQDQRGRWMPDVVDMSRIGAFALTEPEVGSDVAGGMHTTAGSLHGTTFFPQWIEQDGSKTVLYQNDHLEEMRAFRDAGPTYSIFVVPEFARITLFEHVGVDDETVVSVAPGELPSGFADRTN
ncbi:hypothetical protein GCM10027060_07830 [Nesterenkonia halophila]